ncbi:metallophosphoesterase [Martelella sp. HB161492]|uniref:metallophosphoesterase n=1 Tax=Martelella sp. HB161492 TaxID=2720726 RepID=UPI0015908C39|nr:metallophosphoesterase [Martelella sp. HB161492]
MQFLGKLFKKKPEPVAGRRHLVFDTVPAAIFAIGDVHGCIDLARRMEDEIAHVAANIAGESWIIYLGDYVDRGPASAQMIDFLMARQGAGLRRLCLAGNHEEQMLSFMLKPAGDHHWLNFGGEETLKSYGVQDLQRLRKQLPTVVASHIPEEHIEFLDGLPSMIRFPGLCFVHAGLKHGVALEDQVDADLLWIRPDREEAEHGGPVMDGPLVVHGHTPVKQVERIGNRINLDTGAYFTGRLSCLKLAGNKPDSVLEVGGGNS